MAKAMSRLTSAELCNLAASAAGSRFLCTGGALLATFA
jgi:hypothetical protein